MDKRWPALLIALFLCGCPGADDGPPAELAPPPATPSLDSDTGRGTSDDRPTGDPDDTTSSQPKETAPVSPNEETGMTRAQLLALTPKEVLSAGLRGKGPKGLAPKLVGIGTLALSAQLKDAEVPQPALDLCVVAFDRAGDGLGPADQVSEAAFEKLQKDLDVQTQGHPKLATWTEALSEHVTTRSDLDAVNAFLMRVKQAWNTTEALKKTPPPG